MTTDNTTAPDPGGSTPEPAATAAPPPRGFFRRHWIGVTVAALVLVPAFVFTVWAGVALTYTYSKGTRAGFVQKLSKKGWVCKTWEGEMAMTAQPGVAPTIFAFTVRSDSVAAEITRLEGRQVKLWYEEHIGVPSRCFGETGHFVTGVDSIAR